ncbi:MAG: hypothetical protein GY809_09930 [Planctomycetes bacterium]|nr:hypothetical protein [Planctomycetota bacterium]
MATQKIFYECSVCKRLYDKEEPAIECETHHNDMAHLKVVDCVNVNVDSNDLFPEKILLKNEQGEDHLAEYKLSRQGAIADFYQSDDQSQWGSIMMPFRP